MAIFRQGKGCNLFQFPDDFTLVDIETTGLDPQKDSIIELSALKVREGEVVEEFDTLVNPKCEINSLITKLTGITPEMLAIAPSTVEVLSNFYEFIGNDILMAHNANFDINFLYDKILLTTNNILSNDFVDTLRLARRILPDLKHHRLCDISSALKVHVERAHRAIDDCYTTLSCYYKLRDVLRESYHNEDEFLAQIGEFSCCDLKTIRSKKSCFDETHLLYKKVCVFTGVLERMNRAQAAQLVVDLGGRCENNVTKKTNFLILGNNEYNKTIRDGKSTKQRKAEENKLKGLDIEILSEDVFYDLISV